MNATLIGRNWQNGAVFVKFPQGGGHWSEFTVLTSGPGPCVRGATVGLGGRSLL